MSISEKDIKEKENRYKKLIYNKIDEVTSKQAQVIKQIEQIEKEIDINTDLPIMGTTFNLKLSKLSQEFKKAGISMFAEPNKKLDFVSSNFVGDAIIEEMIFYLSRGTQELFAYDSSLEKATKKRIEKIQEIENAGPIKQLSFKIRSLFAPNSIIDMVEFSEEEIEEINFHLSEYKNMEEKLWNYNLKDDVVQSLVNFITNRQYSKEAIPELLEESVIPTLKKLGIEDVVSQLKEDLSREQERTSLSTDKSWELSVLQNLGIQLSSEQIASDFAKKEADKDTREDWEHDK